MHNPSFWVLERFPGHSTIMTKLTVILLLFGASSGPAAVKQEATAEPLAFFEPVRPARAIQVIARRGAMGQAPEETAPALARAIADAVEWVVVDVRLTNDGHHVLFHDERVDGQTDGKGRVRDLTLAEIRALDAGAKFARRFAGARVLSLAEGLELARGRVNLYLDCHEVDPARLAREVIAARMERQVVIFGAPGLLRSVRAAASTKLALMAHWRPGPVIAPWVDDVRPTAVEIDAGDVTPEACREFQRRGIKVVARTQGAADCPAVWDRMAVAGVDWLQTDLAQDFLAWQALKSIRSKPVKIAHHRGAGRYAPENTLPALEESIRLGADFVEFDLQTTRDGGFVLLHDGRLDRTTTGKGPVRDWDLAKVQALDAGSWWGRPFAGTRVPSLNEFLKAAGRRIELYVDAKDIAPEALAQALKRHGLSERAVVYQNVEYLERLRAIDPLIRRMPGLRDPARLDFAAERVRPYAVDARWSILSKDFIDRCHARGIRVFSDALGSHETIEDYQRAIKIGIDLIQTDHPLRVLRAIELLDRGP